MEKRKIKEFISTKKGKAIIAGCVAIMVLAGGIGVYALSSKDSKSEVAKKTEQKKENKDSKKEDAKKAEDAKTAEEELEKAKKSGDSEAIKKAEAKVAAAKSTATAKSTSTAKSSSSSSSSRSSSASSSKQPEKQKIWVVDKPAWTEEFRQPVYVPTWWIRFRGSSERKIYYNKAEWYNDCQNAENVAQYGNGERQPDPSGATEVYATKEHPEEGHWEYR